VRTVQFWIYAPIFPFGLLPTPLGGEVLLTAVAAEIRPLAHSHCCIYLHFAVLLVLLM
jgi:hypothetical protein